MQHNLLQCTLSARQQQPVEWFSFDNSKGLVKRKKKINKIVPEKNKAGDSEFDKVKISITEFWEEVQEYIIDE